jgi:hypothetical protein
MRASVRGVTFAPAACARLDATARWNAADDDIPDPGGRSVSRAT